MSDRERVSMVRPGGFELPTFWFVGGNCALQGTTAANNTQRNQRKAPKVLGWRKTVLYPVHGQLHGQFCSLIGALGSDQVLGRFIRIGHANLHESHMLLLAFRKVSMKGEPLNLTVPINARISTVPVNGTPDGSFKFSKVVTIAQRFGRLSNIHGQSGSFTGRVKNQTPPHSNSPNSPTQSASRGTSVPFTFAEQSS
jgi:hypothetical protein